MPLFRNIQHNSEFFLTFKILTFQDLRWEIEGIQNRIQYGPFPSACLIKDSQPDFGKNQAVPNKMSTLTENACLFTLSNNFLSPNQTLVLFLFSFLRHENLKEIV